MQDLAAGVALELVGSADVQITGDGKKPAVDPVRVGAGIPDILDRRAEASSQQDRPAFARGDASIAHLTVGVVDLTDAIDHGYSLFSVLGFFFVDGLVSTFMRRQPR